MHDRYDVDALTLDAIKKTAGKLRGQKTPQPAAEGRATGREFQQSLVRAPNGEDEVEP